MVIVFKRVEDLHKEDFMFDPYIIREKVALLAWLLAVLSLEVAEPSFD